MCGGRDAGPKRLKIDKHFMLQHQTPWHFMWSLFYQRVRMKKAPQPINKSKKRCLNNNKSYDCTKSEK